MKVGDKVYIKPMWWFEQNCENNGEYFYLKGDDRVKLPMNHSMYGKEATIICVYEYISLVRVTIVELWLSRIDLRTCMFDTDEDIRKYDNTVVDESIKEMDRLDGTDKMAVKRFEDMISFDRSKVNANGKWISTAEIKNDFDSRKYGVKHDGDKLRWSLLPWDMMEKVVQVLEHGAKKYAPDNWKKIDNAIDRYIDAAMRHLTAVLKEEWTDPESKLPHLAHVVCCCLFAMWHNKKGWDDVEKKWEGKK